MDVDRLHILMTTDTLSGRWKYTLNLAKALQPHGVQLYLASMGAMPTEAQITEALQQPNINLYPSNWKLEWMDNPWEDVEAAGYWLKYLASEIRPDLVHLNHYSFGALNWHSPVLMAAHGCALSRWDALKITPSPEQLTQYLQSTGKGLQQADILVAATNNMQQELKKHYEVAAEEHIIPHALPADLIQPAEKENFILAMGRLEAPSQNLHFCNAIAAHGLDWPLMVASEDEATASDLNELNKVAYLGKLPLQELKGHLSTARIYLHPFRYDPWGFGIMEAAGRGCILVLSDLPGLREIWQDAALYVSPTNSMTAHRQLQELILDKPLQQALAEKALARVKTMELERQGSEYFSLYQQLITAQQQSRTTSARKGRSSASQN